MEKVKHRSEDRAALAWLIAGAKGKKRYVLLLLVTQVLSGVFSMGYALFLSGLVNSAVGKDQSGFVHYAISLAALVVVQFILRCVSHYLTEYCNATLENAFKRRLFANLLRKDYAGVMATHSGEWMNRLASDTRVVADGMTNILPNAAATVVRMASALVLLVWFAPEFGSSFVIGGAVIVALTWGLRKILKRQHRDVQAADGKLRVYLSERLSSMMILRAFEQEGTTLAQADSLMDGHKKARMKRNHVTNLFHSGFGVVMNCVYVCGAIYCGYGILRGAMSYGTFTAVLQLVGQTNAPIANFSSYFPKYSAMIGSAERLMEAESYDEEPKSEPAQDMTDFYRNSFACMGLRGASFTYRPVGENDAPRRVLRNLDLEIKKGEYVAFCGPSGCGKSTVLKLLMCLYPLDAGERYLVGGEEMPLDAGWRGLFAYVPQGNQLMSGTIREVVTFGDEEDMAQDQRIYDALKIACADKFVSELPDGLDTQLGERGAGLSEGQMQRIAIARAVFSQRPVLLLDEATSALDEQTEAKLLDNLRSMTDKTVIIITHRPAALDITDKIITFTPDEE